MYTPCQRRVNGTVERKQKEAWRATVTSALACSWLVCVVAVRSLATVVHQLTQQVVLMDVLQELDTGLKDCSYSLE